MMTTAMIRYIPVVWLINSLDLIIQCHGIAIINPLRTTKNHNKNVQAQRRYEVTEGGSERIPSAVLINHNVNVQARPEYEVTEASLEGLPSPPSAVTNPTVPIPSFSIPNPVVPTVTTDPPDPLIQSVAPVVNPSNRPILMMPRMPLMSRPMSPMLMMPRMPLMPRPMSPMQMMLPLTPHPMSPMLIMPPPMPGMPGMPAMAPMPHSMPSMMNYQYSPPPTPQPNSPSIVALSLGSGQSGGGLSQLDPLLLLALSPLLLGGLIVLAGTVGLSGLSGILLPLAAAFFRNEMSQGASSATTILTG